MQGHDIGEICDLGLVMIPPNNGSLEELKLRFVEPVSEFFNRGEVSSIDVSFFPLPLTFGKYHQICNHAQRQTPLGYVIRPLVHDIVLWKPDYWRFSDNLLCQLLVAR